MVELGAIAGDGVDRPVGFDEAPVDAVAVLLEPGLFLVQLLGAALLEFSNGNLPRIQLGLFVAHGCSLLPHQNTVSGGPSSPSSDVISWPVASSMMGFSGARRFG